VVKFRLASLCLAAALALTALPGCVGVWGRAPATPSDAPVAADSREAYNRRVYDVAWDAVRRHYYAADMHGVDWSAARDRHRAQAEAAADDEALYDAINELLGELNDDHTYAASPEEVLEDRRHQGVLVGLISSPYGEQDLQRLVLDVLPGSSAAASGVQPGWVLQRVDGRPPSEVLGPGRLQDGQKVRCEFVDNTNTPRLLTLTATPVSVDPIHTTRVLEGGVVLMRFDQFDLEIARWVRAQLKAHRKAPAIIVDLRQNPGGEALALARALGEFFPHSVPMGRFVRRSGVDESLRASPGLVGARYPGAVAVLVSENSGSSSEIFAHAMQEQKRGIVLGTKTAGAVLGAETDGLPGGGELQVSVRDYLTADGKRLEGAGVTPDIVVETTVDDLRAGRDPVLEAALARLAPTPAR
jgi:carboxyl-terminal processing protease